MPQYSDAQKAQLIGAWTKDLNTFLEKVEAWARDLGWKTERTSKDVEEEPLGKYSAPVLVVYPSAGKRLTLEPTARIVTGAPGRIDLYAWPTLYRVMLLRKGKDESPSDDWDVRTESGYTLPNAFSKELFHDLADQMLAA